MKSSFKILLVEDMESFRGAVVQLLGVYNDVDGVADLGSARKSIQNKSYDVVILDKSLPDGNGIDLIAEIKSVNPNTVVIVLTSDSDFSSVKHCIALGADDYVIKSDNVIPDLLVRIPVAVSKLASNRRLTTLEQQVREVFRYEIIGKSPPTMDLRESILALKGSNPHVLICGESGTGKELVARRLNAIEDDGKRPFVAVNCGAIQESLFESELFGHKKGSFTGAVQDREGRFELAHNGDLFLDEIAELPMSSQVKLLRVIQEGEFTRVGDNRIIRVNCRIIAATNKNLEEMIQKNQFREDLFHRLNVVCIRTPPLRERVGDIPDLAKAFVFQIGGPNFKIKEQSVRALCDYDWPGNIRELRNTIERAVISAKKRKSQEIRFSDIFLGSPEKDLGFRIRQILSHLPAGRNELTPERYHEFLDITQNEYFTAALELVNGNVTELANLIGLGRTTLFRRLQELALSTKRKMEPNSSKYNYEERSTL